jgi:hypothetical protein
VTRFDGATLGLVDLWTAAHAPAHKPHKANNTSKQKRTNDVLPKPDNLKSYRQHKEAGHIVETPVEARAGFLDRPVLVVLAVSTLLAIGLFGAGAAYLGVFGT